MQEHVPYRRRRSGSRCIGTNSDSYGGAHPRKLYIHAEAVGEPPCTGIPLEHTEQLVLASVSPYPLPGGALVRASVRFSSSSFRPPQTDAQRDLVLESIYLIS